MDGLTGIRFGAEITAAATAHGLDPKLLAAVAAQETGGPGSNSGKNIVGDGGHGHGLFQIDDRSWSFASTPAAMDPAANASQAASILADNLQRYGGNVKAALSAYNSGSPTAAGTQTAWPDGSTLGYADSVLRHYAALSTGGGTQEQLLADNRETQANVGALSALSGAQPAAALASLSAALPGSLAAGSTLVGSAGAGSVPSGALGSPPTSGGGSSSSSSSSSSAAANAEASTLGFQSLLTTLQSAATPPQQQQNPRDTSAAQSASQLGQQADNTMAGLVENGGDGDGDGDSDDAL